MRGHQSDASVSRRRVNASPGAGLAAAVSGFAGAPLACVRPLGRAPAGEGS